MQDVVRDVRKVRALRLKLLYILQRLLDPQMRRMFPETQTIKDQHIEVLQGIDRRWRNLTQIRQISKVVKAISHHRQATMDHFEWRYLQFLADAKTGARANNVRDHHRQTTTEVRRLEDVFEHPPDIYPGALVCINAQRSETKVERTNVVEPEDMIGVTVCN